MRVVTMMALLYELPDACKSSSEKVMWAISLDDTFKTSAEFTSPDQDHLRLNRQDSSALSPLKIANTTPMIWTALIKVDLLVASQASRPSSLIFRLSS